MKIEKGISANCSESTVRFATDKLTKIQEEKLYKALQDFVIEYNYETWITREKVFGISCIKINGDGPYNGRKDMDVKLEKLDFMNKVKIEEEEQ